MNDIFISNLSPIRFYEVAPSQLSKYLTKRFDDYPHAYQIKPWQQKIYYKQKWSSSDTTTLQIATRLTPVQLQIINNRRQVVRTINFVKKLKDFNDPDKWVQEAVIDFSGLPDGCYAIDLYAAGQNIPYLYTDTFQIKSVWPDTLLYEYSSTENYHEGVVFATGIVFSYRVEGTIDYPKFQTGGSGFIDQRHNPIISNAVPSTTYPIVIGGTFGVPAYVASLLAYIYSCDTVYTDGHLYGKNPEEEFSYNEQDFYPLKGISFEVMEGLNRPGKTFTPDFNANKKFSVIFNLSTSVYGENSTGGPTDTISIIARV